MFHLSTGKSTEHMGEGSDMNANTEIHSEPKEHDDCYKHGKSSGHMDKGSGMR